MFSGWVLTFILYRCRLRALWKRNYLQPFEASTDLVRARYYNLYCNSIIMIWTYSYPGYPIYPCRGILKTLVQVSFNFYQIKNFVWNLRCCITQFILFGIFYLAITHLGMNCCNWHTNIGSHIMHIYTELKGYECSMLSVLKVSMHALVGSDCCCHGGKWETNQMKTVELSLVFYLVSMGNE